MKKLVLLIATTATFLFAPYFTNLSAQEIQPIPLIDVSDVTKGIGKVIKGIAPVTDAGKWAIAQAKKLNVPLTNTTMEYLLTATEETIDIAGVEFPVWAFGTETKDYPKGKGTVPGPTIIANEGDLVRIIFKNRSKNNHTIHIHGPTIIRYDHDGVPAVSTEPIPPDNQFTYEFIAYPSGTHVYHCHVNANEHMDMGLYGGIVIHGKDDEKVDQDVLVIPDEWDSRFSKEEAFSPTSAAEPQSAEVGHPRRMGNYNLFTLNGAAFTDEKPIVLLVKPGQKIRVRFIDFGWWPHAMHFHGHVFKEEEIDGWPANGQIKDTMDIMPGQRKNVIFTANQEGRWVWHCHIVPHATNDGVYHGGMLFVVIYPDGLNMEKYPLGKPTKIAEIAKPTKIAETR